MDQPDQAPSEAVPGDEPISSQAELELRLAELDSWALSAGRLYKTYQRPDFRAALAWVNRVGMLADERRVYPELRIHTQSKVELQLGSEDGLRLSDLHFAAAVDALDAKDARRR